MTHIVTLPVTDWNQTFSAEEQQQAVLALEAGKVLCFPQLAFRLKDDETCLLNAETVGDAKNVSYDAKLGELRGYRAEGAAVQPLRAMMARFAASTQTLLDHLLTPYQARLNQARTSYRPVEIAGRTSSWRKDDTRLHVDSFPSSPTQGTRILRIFANINPQGLPRSWRLGESFETVAQRFLKNIPAPLPGSSFALNLLGITKRRRSPYDHYMLGLHDSMKADLSYQTQAQQESIDIPAGCTWIVFTDQVSHAAMRGQYLLEQTYHLPIDGMLEPAKAPLRVLERLLDRPLV